eukprot:COSAG05_NODE_12272_length_474_cov_5.050667_1_plen_48_part_01
MTDCQSGFNGFRAYYVVHRTARLRDVKMLQLLLNEVPVRARSDFLNTQ